MNERPVRLSLVPGDSPSTNEERARERHPAGKDLENDSQALVGWVLEDLQAELGLSDLVMLQMVAVWSAAVLGILSDDSD